MGIHVNIGEAKTRLSELVAASIRGEEVILAKAGTPVARIVALEDSRVAAAAEKAARMKAWIGSFEDVFPPGAGDIFLEPDYTDEEIEAFSANLGD
jgi:prevent-host-death family protein